MNKTFVTSDHHFFHKNIIKYCERPFPHEYEMNSFMIEQWNKVVSPNDTVLHIGDFFAGLKGRKKHANGIVEKLNGKKYLIRGNHDHFTDAEFKAMGFEFVGDYLIKSKILFIHYPSVFDEKYKKPGNVLAKRLVEENDIKLIIHGHRHSANPDTPEFSNHFNVCVDLHNFAPVELISIIKSIEK